MNKIQFITHANGGTGYYDGAVMALEGGCRWIQLRMKDADDDLFMTVARRVRKLCSQYGARFIIDDRVEAAASLRADGVHLGRGDMPVDEARRLLGNDFIIGGTANTIEDIRRLHKADADYIGCGPFRFTRTKEKLAPTLGIEGYRSIAGTMKREDIRLPLVAIGGILREDVPQLLAAGVDAIAVSGAILNAGNPVDEMRKFIEISK